MTHALADITFSEADKPEVARLLDGLYTEAAIYLQQAEALRSAAGLNLPQSGAAFYASLLPRQAGAR
jgi:hypothetical protein